MKLLIQLMELEAFVSSNSCYRDDCCNSQHQILFFVSEQEDTIVADNSAESPKDGLEVGGIVVASGNKVTNEENGYKGNTSVQNRKINYCTRNNCCNLQ